MRNLLFVCSVLILCCATAQASPSFFVTGSYYDNVGLGVIDPETGEGTRIDSDANYYFYDVARFDNNHLVTAKQNTIGIYDLNGNLTAQFTDTENPRCVTTYNGEVYYVTNNGNVKKLNVQTGTITSLYNVGTSSYQYNATYDIAVRSETEIFVRKDSYRILQAGVEGYIHNSNIYYGIYDLVEGPNGYLFFSTQNIIGVIDPQNNVSIGCEIDISQADPWIAIQGISYDAQSGILYGLGAYFQGLAYGGYYIFQFDFDQQTETLSMTVMDTMLDDMFVSLVSEFAVHYTLDAIDDQTIPEPCTVLLLGSGLVWILKRNRRV